jgi:hypothetical protein
MAILLWPIAGAGLGDERTYLAMSTLPIMDLIHGSPDWPRYYMIWYKFLGLFFEPAVPESLPPHRSGPEPLPIIAANSLILSMAFSLALFFYVRALSGSILVALATSIPLAVSVLNLANWSKANHVAIIIVLAAMLATVRVQSSYVRWLVLALGLLLASFFRPELFVAFGLALAITACVAVRHAGDRSARPVHIAFAGVMAVVACYHLEFGLPLLTPSGRSQLAIEQHFALNWVRWTKSDLHPWLEHRQIWLMSFGDAQSLLQAFATNPASILRHIADNAAGTAVRIMAAPFTPAGARWTFVGTYTTTPVGYGAALGFVAFAGCVLYCLRRHGAGNRIRREAVVWSVVLAPIIASVITIYPRDHHTLWLATGLLTLGATVIARAVHSWSHFRFKPLAEISNFRRHAIRNRVGG